MRTRVVPWPLALALGFSTAAGAAGPNPGQAEPADFWSTLPGKRHKRDAPLADLADRARPAVVHVRGVAPPEEEASGSPARAEGPVERVSIGTGFIINKKGYVVTNDHVVHGVTRLRVRLHDGREFAACVLGTDAPTDIALLKVDAHEDLPVFPLGDSEEVRVGGHSGVVRPVSRRRMGCAGSRRPAVVRDAQPRRRAGRPQLADHPPQA